MMIPARVVLWVSLVLVVVLFPSRAALVSAQAVPEASVFIDRAVLAYQDKKYDEALKDLEEVLKVDPKNVDALYYQGVVYLALNRSPDARASLEKARELAPKDLDIAFQLGIVYFNDKDYDKAEPLFRQVYDLEPTRPNIGYYLGFIEYRKRNYREALNFLQANSPSDDDYAQLARFYAGLSMTAMGYAREARTEIEQALRVQPVSPLTAPAQRFGEILERAAQREKLFRGDLRLGVYYDTNVPVVPVASSDLTAETLRQTTARQKSEGEIATLNLAYTFLRTPEWEGTISHRFLQTYNNHLTKFDTQSNTPSINVLYRSSLGDIPTSSGLQYTYDFITLGNKRFTQRNIVTPYTTLAESASNSTTFQTSFQFKDFFHDKKVIRAAPVGFSDVRDATNYMVGATHFILFEEGRDYLKLGYQFDYDDATGKNWAYRGNRLLFGFQYTLPWWDIKFRHDLDWHWRMYQSRNTLLPATAPGTVHRIDKEPVNLLSLSKDLDENWTVSLEYLYDKNRSNLPSFAYNRYVVTTSVTWRFDAGTFGF